MISYQDHRCQSRITNRRFRDASLTLSDRLLQAARGHGDETHQSGKPDYVVRVLENYEDPDEQLEADISCFAISATEAGVQVLTKFGTAHGAVIAEVSYNDGGAWVDEIARLFDEFRGSLVS